MAPALNELMHNIYGISGHGHRHGHAAQAGKSVAFHVSLAHDTIDAFAVHNREAA